MTPDDVMIVVIAGLLSTSCALLGSFLVLRRQALLPDAVSHAVLPGIVLVFLLTGDRGSAATVLCHRVRVLCVAGSEWLRRTGVVASDAALARVPRVVLLGVLGISAYARERTSTSTPPSTATSPSPRCAQWTSSAPRCPSRCWPPA